MEQSIPEGEMNRIREALFAGRKIEAIKLYRLQTGKGLKESKDAIDEMEEQLRAADPQAFNSPAARTGCAGSITIVLCLTMAAAWFLAYHFPL